MIAKPPHDRKLGLNGIALTKQRNNPHDVKALSSVRDQIERTMIDSEYLKDAPFSWVTVAVRYGLKNDDTPSYRPVNKKYGDLPLSIEIDAQELTGASIENLEKIFREAVLRALIHAGKKFDRPIEALEQLERS